MGVHRTYMKYLNALKLLLLELGGTLGVGRSSSWVEPWERGDPRSWAEPLELGGILFFSSCFVSFRVVRFFCTHFSFCFDSMHYFRDQDQTMLSDCLVC